MMSLRLEPILDCPQLKVKYASSNGNWTRELDNSALKREHLVKVESTSLVRESFSTCHYLQVQVTWALWIDLAKQWRAWSRHSRGSHHDSMAGLTSLQQNKEVLRASTTTSHTFSTQDCCVVIARVFSFIHIYSASISLKTRHRTKAQLPNWDHKSKIKQGKWDKQREYTSPSTSVNTVFTFPFLEE